MTVEEAKIILQTYKLPMTAAELAKFKQALALVAGNWGKAMGSL